ncbi:hypothetical protein LWM68_03055 [Niabella sp. W65]|nr:hypothetical protein [Niabella sp. W65]MCH7361846.1 hypothetical protein [Niabella sp. W65]
MRRLKTSEYALIAFPLMQEMNIRELLPMDCQDYDLNWSASAVAFTTGLSLLKRHDSFLCKRTGGYFNQENERI